MAGSKPSSVSTTAVLAARLPTGARSATTKRMTKRDDSNLPPLSRRLIEFAARDLPPPDDEAMFTELIARKRRMFPNDSRIIGDYRLKRSNGVLSLEVIHTSATHLGLMTQPVLPNR